MLRFMGDFLPCLLATVPSFLVSHSISGMPGQDLCIVPAGGSALPALDRMGGAS